MTRDPAAKEGHTPGPWRIRSAANLGTWTTTLEAVDGPLIGETWCNEKTEGGKGTANARRIVACVNAIEGTSTELLESDGAGFIERLNASAHHFQDDNDHLRERVKELERALRFYADKSLYEGVSADSFSRAEADGGDIAKAALSKSPK